MSISPIQNPPTPPIEEKTPLKEKSGILWRCVSRELDETSQGYLYRFRPKSKYNVLQNPENGPMTVDFNGSHFPAVEGDGFDMLFLSEDPSQRYRWIVGSSEAEHNAHELVQHMLNCAPTLRKLGYRFTWQDKKVFLTLPSHKVLQSRWEEMRLKDPSLPRLTFVSSKGIAGDLDFINSQLDENALLLSEEKEFLHDHFAHILAMLLIALDRDAKPQCEGENPLTHFKKKLRDWAYPLFSSLEASGMPTEQHRILAAILGGKIDECVAQRTHNYAMNEFCDNIYESLLEIGQNPEWERYFSEKRGVDTEASPYRLVITKLQQWQKQPPKEIEF